MVRAFTHLDAANALKSAPLDCCADSTQRWVQQIIEAFPIERFNARPAEPQAGRLPVFVLGISRSGTSLIEQILA